jgi:acyl-CoA thioesterase I
LGHDVNGWPAFVSSHAWTGGADMTEPTPSCETPQQLTTLKRPLPKFAEALRRQATVNIVAIGSSSTEGEGSTDKATLSYPARLKVHLEGKFPGVSFNISNAGVGGQEAPDEAARFKTDVLAKAPALVIWQVGTNAAWKDYFLDDVQIAILHGLTRLPGSPADAILMNLQYAPAMLSKKTLPATELMLRLIDDAAETIGVNVFDRFAIMKYWNTTRGIPFDQMISNADGNMLHQNDWSYNCIASALADAIAGAATG